MFCLVLLCCLPRGEVSAAQPGDPGLAVMKRGGGEAAAAAAVGRLFPLPPGLVWATGAAARQAFGDGVLPLAVPSTYLNLKLGSHFARASPRLPTRVCLNGTHTLPFLAFIHVCRNGTDDIPAAAHHHHRRRRHHPCSAVTRFGVLVSALA